MKKLTSFSSTQQFFKYVTDQLGARSGKATKEAGDLFEQFTKEWHLEFGEYVNVYDANDAHSIPSHIIDKIDAWELLQKGANSFAIDKICETRFGEIDIHQDKSTLHTDKKLSTDKAAKMMSIRDNPVKNVRNFVINTTAADLSHYAKLWKDQPPLCYGFDAFVPDEDDVEAVERDKQFWLNIKAKYKGKSGVKIFGFKSRGPQQDDYIKAGVDFATKSLGNSGYAKWYQLGTGALGKSVLDPIILAELEQHFHKAYTHTPQPVNVSFYHSSKTLPKNGWEEVQRRRARGIYDEVIVVSGTSVIDGEADNYPSTRFPKTTNVVDAVIKIKRALENNKSVLLLTLYHHAGQIEGIKRALTKYYPGFKYWYRKRDECDWPCSNSDSAYAPALDHRTDSVITFGSSGTERLGKDPVVDYGLNNTNIHGVCAHNFTWAQAEDAGLVKPLILVMPSIRESEVAALFPEFVNPDGRVDWNMRVKGVPVDNVMPTAGLIADLVALAKSLVEFPQIKRLLTFSHMVKTNKLAEVNWPWVCKKVLKNSAVDKQVKKLFWQVLNDEDYNTQSIKCHTMAIKKAKSHSRYAIGSCKVFGRGYDDKFSPKHHAAIHFDAKTIVNSVQEIWRVTRLDPNAAGKPFCGDPNAYYILPMRLNDIDDTPTWSEDRLQQLKGILQFNKNIYDEFYSIAQNPSGSRKARVRGLNGRIWIPEDFDANAFGGLITWVAQSSKGQMVEHLAAEAHTWLLEQYLQLEDLNTGSTVPINKQFLEIERFKPFFECYKLYNTVPRAFRERFWAGEYNKYLSPEIYDITVKNLLEFKEYKEKIAKNKEIIREKIKQDAHDMILKQIAPENNYFSSQTLQEKYNVPKQFVGPITGPLARELYADKLHWKNQARKVYNILAVSAEDYDSVVEWSDSALLELEKYGISTHNVSSHTLRKRFILVDYHNALSAEEWEYFSNIVKSVKKRAYLANGATKKGKPVWNSGIDTNSKEYKEWQKKVKQGQKQHYAQLKEQK